MTRIVLAYDRSPITLAGVNRDFELLQKLIPHVGPIKVGLEAMSAVVSIGGYETDVAKLMRPRIYEEFGGGVLWDAKLHDIGNTMAATVRNLTGKVSGITIHSSASKAGLASVVKALDENVGPNPTKRITLFGVTVLTDMDAEDCEYVFGSDTGSTVCRFAEKLISVGVKGIVCSGKELQALRRAGLTDHLTTLVPGIRPDWASTDDQKRVMTPGEAASLGADFIVVGRPILGHADPVEATKLINAEIAEALG